MHRPFHPKLGCLGTLVFCPKRLVFFVWLVYLLPIDCHVPLKRTRASHACQQCSQELSSCIQDFWRSRGKWWASPLFVIFNSCNWYYPLCVRIDIGLVGSTRKQQHRFANRLLMQCVSLFVSRCWSSTWLVFVCGAGATPLNVVGFERFMLLPIAFVDSFCTVSGSLKFH